MSSSRLPKYALSSSTRTAARIPSSTERTRTCILIPRRCDLRREAASLATGSCIRPFPTFRVSDEQLAQLVARRLTIGAAEQLTSSS